MKLRICPIEFRDANEFVALHHRHHEPVRGHRFSLCCRRGDDLHGVVIVGRPVARNGGDPLEVLEVTRLCTRGEPHVCSMLYAAAARVGREMGYIRIQTYTLDTESGVSLLAAGWTDEGPAGGGQWNHSNGHPQLFGGPNRRTDQPICEKRRWAKTLNAEAKKEADRGEG